MNAALRVVSVIDSDQSPSVLPRVSGCGVGTQRES